MSETEQNIIEAQPRDSEGKPDQTKSPAKQKTISQPGRGLAILAIIVAAGSLSVSGYFGWQAKILKQQTLLTGQHQAAFKAGVEQLQSQMARQQAALRDAVAGVQPIQNQLYDVQKREERLVERVDGASRRLKDLEGSSRDQWRLAEVEYLMRLANQRLLMGTDISSAHSLLQSADEIIKELDDYSLFQIREALAEDMAVVRAISNFDQETTYLRLQALAGLIPRLQLLDDQRLKVSHDNNAEITSFTPETTGWQEKAKSILLDTWQRFIGLFRINTQREKPVEALLSLEQEMMIRQNLRLIIEQAKLSVLTREPAIYRSSIEQAKEWITHYFTLGGEVRTFMLAELDELLTIKVITDLPDINRSLEALKTYQFQLEAVAVPVKAEETSSEPEAQSPRVIENNEDPVTQEEPRS